MSKKFEHLKQSKKSTALETTLNVGSGMFLAFSISQLAAYLEPQIQQYIWAGFHWSVSASSNVFMTAILTFVSITRGYCWRRAFNHHHAKKLHEKLTKPKKQTMLTHTYRIKSEKVRLQ